MDDIFDLVADFEVLERPPRVAENDLSIPVGIEESKAFADKLNRRFMTLLDQITTTCNFDPRAINKLIEGLRIWLRKE